MIRNASLQLQLTKLLLIGEGRRMKAQADTMSCVIQDVVRIPVVQHNQGRGCQFSSNALTSTIPLSQPLTTKHTISTTHTHTHTPTHTYTHFINDDTVFWPHPRTPKHITLFYGTQSPFSYIFCQQGFQVFNAI